MDWFLQSHEHSWPQDFPILIVIPLMFFTAKHAWANRRSLFDKTLTSEDRQILMRLAMFWLFPVVVLLHELGHAVAIISFGGQVKEFHYAILSGYVAPSGQFSPAQELIINLAGNIVEVVIGLLLLITLAVVKSPPIVALLAYLAVWSIGGTVILYTLMSLIGWYGDWTAIYTSPLHGWIAVIAAIHILLVGLVLFLVFGSTSHIWFAERTIPDWAKKRRQLLSMLERHATSVRFLSLAWLYYEADLYRLAEVAIDNAFKADPQNLEPWLLHALIKLARNKPEEALESFQHILSNPKASSLLRARANLEVGSHHLSQSKALQSSNKQSSTTASMQELHAALSAYTQACNSEPDLADAHYYRAVVLNKLGLHNEAEAELLSTDNMRWLDHTLKTCIPGELKKTQKNQRLAQ